MPPVVSGLSGRRRRGWWRLLLAPALLFPWLGNPASGGEVLRAVAAFPVNIDFTKSFLDFIDKVNRAANGRVEIRYLGGPEVIPDKQQPDAVRRGAVDIHYGPASYFIGQVAEGDALVGSRLTPAEARANGAFDLIDRIYRDKFGVEMLGHFDAGVGFNIYLRRAPPLKADGSPDFSALTLRSQPIYREFFRALGARVVSIPIGEAMTAFGRRIADGTGWSQIGLTDLGWQRYLRYRIDPPFFQSELVTIVNLKRWRSLPADVRALIRGVARAHEQSSYRHFQTLIGEHRRREKEAGITAITLAGQARADYLAAAYAAPWERLKARAAENYAPLRALFFDPPGKKATRQ